MTDKERVTAVFRREKIDRIVFQPRLDHWLNVNRARGTLPEKYKNSNIIDLHKILGVSLRYYWGLPEPREIIIKEYKKNIKLYNKKENNETFFCYKTPLGDLSWKVATGEWGCSSHVTEYPVKKPDDLKIIEFILENTTYKFNYEFYNQAVSEIGDLGVFQASVLKSPFQELLLFYMGLENTVYALSDYPEKIKQFIKNAEILQDEFYKVIENSPVEIFSFGENIDSNLDSPKFFCEYLIPYYIKRVRQLHNKNKFCHIHIDGSVKNLLPYINKSGFDAIEALTPFPQGDVSIEEIREAIGKTILIDGIPALYFCNQYSIEELKNFTCKILDMFSPNIILGISDELPPDGDIERIKVVEETVKNFRIR